MKTRINGRQFLALAMGMLIVAGGVVAKLWHDTVADLSANMDAVHADYQAIRATALYRATSPGERGDARPWTACAGLQEEAVQALDRVHSQIGIVFLSKAVDQVIADGCEMGANALSVDGLAEAFDARAELYRWRWFAALLVATHGGSLEAHQGLRDMLPTSRKVALCVGSQAEALRRVSEVRPAATLAGFYQECESAANGAGSATHREKALEVSGGLTS